MTSECCIVHTQVSNPHQNEVLHNYGMNASIVEGTILKLAYKSHKIVHMLACKCEHYMLYYAFWLSDVKMRIGQML